MTSHPPAPFTLALLSLVALMLPAAGCGGGDGGGWAGSVEALPSGGERVRNPASGLWRPGEAWQLESELRVGTLEGEGPAMFGRIAALEVRDGRLYVAEAQAREVRVFAADGAHVRTFGGPGAGPGEFVTVDGLAFDTEGTLWVPDGRGGRYARYDTTGTLLEYRPRRTLTWSFRGGVDEKGRLWDSDLVAMGLPGVSPLMAGAGLPGAGREVLRAAFALDGTEVGDSVWIPEAAGVPEPFTTEDGRTFVGVPFAPRMHFTFDPRGYLWFGDSGAYRIVQLSLANDTVRIIERPHEPLPVTTADIDSWLESVARLRERGLRVDRSRIPATKPVFDGLIVGEDGELWVRLVTEADETTFDVFGADGRYLGAVNAGPGLAPSPLPIIREGAMWAVTRDDLDVSYVTRLRLVKGTAGS